LKIRRLDIIGFKSFAEKALLRIDDGISGIVGPNGCGKSNIVDAVRWVMGEQSARRLRGKTMEDVIFAGSETKPPMGMAEVRMTLENDGRNVPPEYASYAEIVVGRRLFRSGESEYSINKTPCRLMDVQELFMGTGVGTRAYSIISQGQIGVLVSQKPLERRALIEEAAGVSKYKARKRIAERKMEATRQNLLRVSDVIAEIKRNIDSLKRQARKAARYNKLRKQLRDIELHIAAHRQLELQASKNHLTLRQKNLSAKEHELQGTLAKMESSVEQRRTRMLDDDHQISGLQEALLSTDNQIKLNEKDIEFLTREVDSLAKRGTQSADEIERLQAEATSVREQIERHNAELTDLDGSAQLASQRLADRESAHRAQASRVDELQVELEGLRQSQIDLGEQAGEWRSRISNQTQRLEDLQARLNECQTERNSLEKTHGELTANKQRQTESLNRSRQLHLDLVQKREVNENTLAELEAQAKSNSARGIALREEAGNKRSRLKSLEEIERNYEGCLSGVRWVMQKAKDEQEDNQVVGLVADILEAPPVYETAVQAVLGDRLQSVVVQSQSAGVQAIDYLKRESEGRSSFIPMALRSRSYPPDISKVEGPGVIGPMRKLLDYQQEYDSVVKYLLGDVVVVEDLPTAMSIWSANGHEATLVTLEGDVLEPQGALSGGSLEGPGTHLLQNKREMKELADKLVALEAEQRMVADQQGKLDARLAELGAAIESLKQNSHEEEIRIIDQQKDLTHTSEQLGSATQRLEELRNLGDSLRADITGVMSKLQQGKESLEGIGARQVEVESGILRLRSLNEKEKNQLAVLAQEVIDLKVEAAASIERRESARRNLEHLRHTREESEQRLERLQDELTSGNREAVSGRQKIEENRNEISTLLTTREKQQDELTSRREAYERLLAEVQEEEQLVKDCRKELDQASHQLADTHTECREVDLEMIHLAQDVKRNHKEAIVDCLSAYHLLPSPTPDQQEKAEKLRGRIERMGDVNPHAEEAYEELVERYEFLTTQSQDLTESLEKLQKVIQKINRTSRKRFREAFEAINEKFQQVFPRLFSGGKAYLAMEENQDVLEAGVEIVAQPPGKRLQNMELLSGGEKALTAVSLLFSIFLVKPTPFCLLDEVDAPLDDVNLDRVNSMIQEMSKTSQFIIITHNKRTMETIDRLYGITMEEPGASTVVTVQLKDVPEVIEQAG
jgi:chromosome segregation protein